MGSPLVDVPAPDQNLRCRGQWKGKRCGRKLARCAGKPWVIQCHRCKFVNASHHGNGANLTQDRPDV